MSGEAPKAPGHFTLFELILVILLLAGVGWVAISRARVGKERRMIANESSAFASLKNLVTAEEQYKTTSGTGNYATLSELSAASPPYLDSVLGVGRKNGYTFVLTLGTPADSNYAIQANPLKPGRSGNRRFFVDRIGVIRSHTGQPAFSADSPLD